MSAADSEESRWPDFATASIRTQSRRSTVAQRSSSAIEGFASARSASFGGGLGSGTGLRCLTSARLAADPICVAGYGASLDGTVRPDSRERDASFATLTRPPLRDPCCGEQVRPRLVWLAVAALATAAASSSSPGTRRAAARRRRRAAGRSRRTGDAPSEQPQAATRAAAHGPRDARRRSGGGPLLAGAAARRRASASVARVVRAYVDALDAHDGERACGLFVPGALAQVDFPRDRGTCARSLSASIGYRDPRGFPVYDRSRIGRIPSVTDRRPKAPGSSPPS